MFSVWIKLNKSIFKRNNKFNNTVTARTWVLSTKRTRPWPSTGLVSEQKNTGSLYLLKWLMLFFRMSRCCIVITEKNITIVLAFDSFSKKCCITIFLIYSKEGRLFLSHVGIQNVRSDDCCNDTKHYQVPSEKQGRCKM